MIQPRGTLSTRRMTAHRIVLAAAGLLDGRRVTTADGILIEVEAVVPLVPVQNASGRLTRRPYRKAATFLLTDGPARTLRKARTKRAEPRFTGDFRTVLVLGEDLASGDRVVALASRVPPAAQQLVVHRDLVRPVGPAFAAGDLQRVAAGLLGGAEVLRRLGRQGFLYSATEPPAELVGLLEQTLSRSVVGGPATMKAGLDAFIARNRPDELILTAQIFDHAARRRSFEIVAEVMREEASPQAKIESELL